MRHLCRLFVLVLISLLILLNDYSSLKGQYGGQQKIDESSLYQYWDRLHGSSPHMEPYQAFFQGSLWSLGIGKFRLTDPLALFCSVGFLWVGCAIPVLLTILLGRLYCGWLCPMGLFSETVGGLRRLAGRFGVQFFSFPFSPKIKYLILGIGMSFCLLASVSFFHPIYPPRIISDFTRETLVGTMHFTGPIFVAILLLIELLFVERLWCRCLCPGGALYSVLSRFRVLRINRDETTCTDCGFCDEICPHALGPAKRILGGECDNCGMCRTVCAPKSLQYNLRLPFVRRGD